MTRADFPYLVAFWVRTEPEDLLRLYVVSPTYDPRDIRGSYRAVVDAYMATFPHQMIVSQVYLLRPESPAAQAVLGILRHQPGNAPLRVLDRPALGELDIQEAYIYPRPGGALTPAEVPARALRLMQADAPPRNVSLRDGSTFRGLPVGLRLNPHRRFDVTFFDEDAKAERVLPADEVVAID